MCDSREDQRHSAITALAALPALLARVRDLEARIAHLRSSRRVLMNVLSSHDRERRLRIATLERDNRRLKQRSAHLAELAMSANLRLVRSTGDTSEG